MTLRRPFQAAHLGETAAKLPFEMPGVLTRLVSIVGGSLWSGANLAAVSLCVIDELGVYGGKENAV